MTSEQIDQLLDKIEEKLMHNMHRTVFNQISTEYEEKDLALQKRIRSLNWITALRLGLDIKENSPEIRELIDKAITGKYHLFKFTKSSILFYQCLQHIVKYYLGFL